MKRSREAVLKVVRKFLANIHFYNNFHNFTFILHIWDPPPPCGRGGGGGRF